MNSRASSLSTYGARGATLLGSASLLTMATAIADRDRAYAGEAGEMVAQVPEEIPENVLITGSLIRGTAAVGVPVVNLSPMDFAQTGALTTADLFRNFPAANIQGGDVGTASGARIERGQKVNLRGLDGNDAVREIMMVDGMRTPPSGNGLCAVDPSIIPSISLDHIDVLVDGASATYGSDAESGVINLILRRNYDGAQTQLRFTERAGGGRRYQFGQLWGRTWDGGQITLSYEWYNETPVKGSFDSRWGLNFSPWGYDNRTSIGSSSPATISKSPFPAGAAALGTGCGYFNVPASGLASTSSTCYSVPLATGQNFQSALNNGVGPLAPGSGSTLNWTTFSQDTNFAGPLNPSAGTRNQFNPYGDTWYSPAEQRNGGAMTVDQRLTKDISFYGSGFYSNRRAQFLNPNNTTPTGNNSLTQIAVPTFNPYYPTGTFCPAGQPATCLPTNLRVSYDVSIEQPGMVSAFELIGRYQVGLNIALPAGWESQIFYSQTYDSNADVATASVNKAAVSAALGWTIAALPPQSATGPSFGTWTKPASIPYLNLFCDPFAFQCNSATTLNYIDGFRSNVERWWINEKGVKADGPLFDLPGGTVKMAVGADLTANAFTYVNQDNTNGANLTINPVVDALHNNVWAVFTQLNVPVFSDSNAILGFRRLELEVSWRHDQYANFGGTSNPKVAFNWSPIEDLTFKGAWGSNFRAPQFAEISAIAKGAINPLNLPAAVTSAVSSPLNACGAAGAALPGPTSGAGKEQLDAFNFNNAMAAAGAPGYATASGCINALAIPQPNLLPGGSYVNPTGQAFAAFAQPGITAGVNGFLQPEGFYTLGGQRVSQSIRQFTGNGLVLRPETAASWSGGFDYAPTNFLRGLDIQATYYVIKINNELRAFTNPSDSRFQDATLPFAFVTPDDVGCPTLPNSVRPSIPIPANLVPSACPQWLALVAGTLTFPKSAVLPAAQTLVYFINDGATFNQGWEKLDGFDWNVSYDWDMGNIGAFNVGAIGTYYLHDYSNTLPGSPLSAVTDALHTTTGSANAQAVGVTTSARVKMRSRIGWSNGPWNVTGFMDYQGHFYNGQTAPPNVNNTCVAAGVGVGGGTFPCAQNQYSNLEPPWISFDLSIGYDTGEDPANDYLKNIGLQMVIQNIFDKRAFFLYKPGAQGGPPSTIAGGIPDFGRQISFIVTKTW